MAKIKRNVLARMAQGVSRAADAKERLRAGSRMPAEQAYAYLQTSPAGLSPQTAARRRGCLRCPPIGTRCSRRSCSVTFFSPRSSKNCTSDAPKHCFKRLFPVRFLAYRIVKNVQKHYIPQKERGGNGLRPFPPRSLYRLLRGLCARYLRRCLFGRRCARYLRR